MSSYDVGHHPVDRRVHAEMRAEAAAAVEAKHARIRRQLEAHVRDSERPVLCDIAKAYCAREETVRRIWQEMGGWALIPAAPKRRATWGRR